MLEEHLSEALRRYEEVMAELSVPETHGDSALLQRLLKEQAELSPSAGTPPTPPCSH